MQAFAQLRFFSCVNFLKCALTHGAPQTDCALANGYKGPTQELVLGHEFVGVVAHLGARVAASHAHLLGKRVVGEINVASCHGTCAVCACGDEGLAKSHCVQRKVLGILGLNGCFAQFACLPAANLLVVPDALRDDQAVFVEPTAAAFRIVEQLGGGGGVDGPLRCVLVMGDGKLAMLVVQALKTLAVQRLCVLCKHGARAALIQAATGVDCILAAGAEASGTQWDVVVECTGSPMGLPLALALVRPRGTVILKSTCAGDSAAAAGLSLQQQNDVVVREVRVQGSRCGPFARALQALLSGEVAVDFIVEKRVQAEQGAAAVAAAARGGGGGGGGLKVLVEF